MQFTQLTSWLVCSLLLASLLLLLTPRVGSAQEADAQDTQQADDAIDWSQFDINPEELQTHSSGLKYIIREKGDGRVPESGDNITAHYTGYLTNGKKFDSSVDRGQPFQFPLGQRRVIRGWDIGFGLFPVGTKAVLVVPPDLAYGERGAGGAIPPNSTLIFEVELLDAQEAKPLEPDWETLNLNPEEFQQTESGLQYVIREEGDGPVPEPGQTVVAHYTGYLVNGKKFDSSVDRGQPFEFPLGQGRVIRGWDKGFGLFPVGTKAVLIIPPELGYGSRGAGGAIPPDATLVFEVELLDVK